MFDLEFFPTPSHVIDLMCEGLDLTNKTILEPSAGNGNIVDYVSRYTQNVLACEKNEQLRQILKGKCNVINSDFLKVQSSDISHVNFIIMNPPFSNAHEHILHAWEIAPDNCKIISLCNYETIKNTYSERRKYLKTIISENGTSQNIGPVFETAERKTGVEIGLIILNKGSQGYSTEFEGFFMDDEPEERQENGIMSYNFIRDIVNRYVQAVKIFDLQIESAVQMNTICNSFFKSGLSVSITKDEAPIKRADFKKDLQKNAWNFIFNKMKLQKYVTKGVREDINKFVEQQEEVPFTMRNIYKMLEIIVATREQTVDRAILEAFDKLTERHHENRMNVKGWKTNSHFLVGKKFILPYQISQAKEYGCVSSYYNSMRNYDGVISDLEKALCFITGTNYDELQTLNSSINRNTYGEWYECFFFKYKGYKNGNMHFEFKDDETWGKFNQRVAQIKGFPLYEYKEQTAYQKRNTGRNDKECNNYDAPKTDAKVLFKVKL